MKRVLAVCLGVALSLPLHADIRGDEQSHRLARAQNAVWQVLFGRRVVTQARKQLGRPYVWGAKSGERGFDCSGLTAFVYGSLGVGLAPNAVGQYGQGVPIDKAGLLAGDLVFFSGQGSPLHVGIYTGDGQFLHAPGSGKVIQAAAIDSAYFKNRYIGARRVTPSMEEVQRNKHLHEEKAP